MENINIGETRGVIRKIDELGRVTLPKEFRDTLELKEKDEVEIFLLKDGFYIRKIQKLDNYRMNLKQIKKQDG
ncbi:MAG TPA: AbrB/MazE/SpoVT family DNA-binding domain-containing protein [Candidatus Merdicola faecigallinarum]|uniref:AbrB/MazE/SpoVT family DNA-binding domain-containing protein n=1 Tax=Candidatus Merdicola faecigallinarum TaxID=2840862 RepID=A0A9D1M2A3_9FIRM|nr:AbrB/MazE/SpoVT family DNA-binding domain-containing protein [Candidatus Merdicola faecigallinarum]